MKLKGSLVQAGDSIVLKDGATAQVTLAAGANGSAITLTLPPATDTLVSRTSTDTLTNKTLTAPVIGAATATSINKVAITAPATSATLTISDGKTLACSNTMTLTSNDSVTVQLSSGGVVAYQEGSLAQFAATASAALAGIMSDETGGGSLVFATSPTLVTPILGVASGTSLALTGTGGAGFIDVAEQSASPSAPASSTLRVYGKTDESLYFQNSSGTEQQVGSGSGEKNYIATGTSSSAGWTVTGTVAAATDTTSSIPRPSTTKTAVKVTSGSAADYAYKRFTLDDADFNKKLKIQFDQDATIGTDWKVEVYSNTASNYGGTSTRLALSTDSSAVSLLPGLTGTYRTTFDSPGATAKWLELRVVRVANSSALYLSDIVVGPGIVMQGYAGSEWQAVLTSTLLSITTGVDTTNSKTQWRREGDTMHVKGHVIMTGAGASSTLLLTIPNSKTVDTSKTRATGSTSTQGYWAWYDDSGASTGRDGAVTYSTSTAVTFRINSSAAQLQMSALAANDVVGFDFTVPIAEWAGSGTVNVAQNDLMYVSNDGSGGTAAGTQYTTGMVTGPSGSQFVAVDSTTALNKTTDYKVTWPYPVNSSSVRIQVTEDGGTTWVENGGSLANLTRFLQGASTYGMYYTPTTSTTGFVSFGNKGRLASNVGYAGDGSSWTGIAGDATKKWRVVASVAGQAVGFGAASDTLSGLISGESSGTFTATITGGVSASATCYYARVGKVVTLYMTGLTNTSSSTAQPSIAGLPAALVPARNQDTIGRVMDNSTTAYGIMQIRSDGTISLFKDAAGTSTFTSSNNKGLTDATVTYLLI